MAKRFIHKLAVLAKVETIYGVDVTPTGAANAMLMTDVTLEPMAGDQVSRDLLLPYFGNQGQIPVGTYVRLEGSVEVAGSGTAGTAPAMGPLLRACGMREVVTAGVSVAYSPVSDGFDALSIYYNLDGVLHKLLGARGTFRVPFATKQIPRIAFSFSGLMAAISDTALPALTQSAWKKPVPVSKLNTSFSLHGAPRVAESVEINFANTIVPRMLIGDESIQLTGRSATGTAVIEAEPLASVNWFVKATSPKPQGAFELIHGTAAGNIVTIASATTEIGSPTQGQTDGIANYTLPVDFVPSGAGNDELTITFT